MNLDAEVLILGGGCAGLSLAYRLASQPGSPTVILIEARRRYVNDRTWCGWRIEPHPFAHCLVTQWHTLRLRDTGREIEFNCADYPYEMIDAGCFYTSCLSRIDAAAHIERRVGRVAGVDAHRSHLEVSLENGSRLRGRWVVDTLPRPARLVAPWRWQDFAGLEVSSPRLEDTEPTLMDFSIKSEIAEPDQLDFLYRLPIAPGRTLFEWTRFARPASDPHLLEQALHRYLDQLLDGDYRVLRHEHGSLPMAPPSGRPSRAGGRHILAGAYAGAMRASTGYAFHAIQRWSDHCASALSRGEAPRPVPSRRAIAALDRIFMTALERHPPDAAALFCQLFERCPSDALVRFLAGHPSLSDVGRVINSLPKLPLLTAALASVVPNSKSPR